MEKFEQVILGKLPILQSKYQLAKDNSEFYGIAYSSFSDKLSIDTFTNLPFLESKHLSEHGKNMLIDVSKCYYVFSSGGSTGSPKFIFLSKYELHRNSYFHGLAYKACGIGSRDRVGIFGIPGHLNSEFTVYLGLEHTDCFIIPIGTYGNLQLIVEYIKHFQINTLVVLPSDIIPLTSYVDDSGISLGIDKLITGGEPLYKPMEDYISNKLGVMKFGSTYQIMDCGTIGY